jgi:transposase
VGEFAALIGLDWGDAKHAIALRPRSAGRAPVEHLDLEHSAESLHAWIKEMGERFGHQPVAIAVESSKGAVVAALMEYPWVVIYPIHPSTSRRFSTAFTPSGAKDDMPDAQILLEIIESHRQRLRVLVPQDAATRRVALLVEVRRKLVDSRTQATNQITSLLKNYYPQALELTGESLCAPMAMDFLERWPELALLQRAKAQTVRDFYQAHNVRRPELIEARLALIKGARPLTEDRALCEVSVLHLAALVAEVRALSAHVAKADEAIATAFDIHPDAHIFRSLPGAGSALAPRLCVLFGADRNRWSNASELQKYYGIAPVTERSGRQKHVHWRWSAPVFARQSLVEWAGQSIKWCAWAKAYYLQQKGRKNRHSAILRSLAFKWLRILWRCWRDSKTYDDSLYLAQLRERKAPLLEFLPAA